MDQTTGKYIIVAGIIIVLIGIIIYFFHGSFKWFGKLPGDINIRKENFSFYFPVVSMIIVSVVLTLIVNFIRRWL